MILSSERMIGEQNNPIVNEHLKLEVRTLQMHRDPAKLEKLLQVKI